jgi:hypothetical protein
MEWKHPQSPSKKKFKSQPSAGKLILQIQSGIKGPLIHLEPKSEGSGAFVACCSAENVLF